LLCRWQSNRTRAFGALLSKAISSPQFLSSGRSDGARAGPGAGRFDEPGKRA
jgi:hypothetical protein